MLRKMESSLLDTKSYRKTILVQKEEFQRSFYDEFNQISIDKNTINDNTNILLSFINDSPIENSADRQRIEQASFRISYQFILNNIQLNISINALHKAMAAKNIINLCPEILDSLLAYIINENSEIEPNLIFEIISMSLKHSYNNILLIANSNYPLILLNFDNDKPFLSKAIWKLLKALKTGDDNFFLKGIEILNYLMNLPQNQIFAIKYTVKFTSICPRCIKLDMKLLDSLITLAKSGNEEMVSTIFHAASRKRFQSDELCQIAIFYLSVGVSDELIYECLTYLGQTMELWSHTISDDSKIAEILTRIICKSSFRIVEKGIKIVEIILKNSRKSNMKLMKLMIDCIDTTDVGKLCLIAVTSAIEKLDDFEFFEIIAYFEQNITLIDEILANEPQSEHNLVIWSCTLIHRAIDEMAEQLALI